MENPNFCFQTSKLLNKFKIRLMKFKSESSISKLKLKVKNRQVLLFV